jgi:hypothetical protein
MGRRAPYDVGFIRVELEAIKSHPVGDAGGVTRHQGRQNGHTVGSAVIVDLSLTVVGVLDQRCT